MDIHLSDIDVRISPSQKELFKISDFKIKFKDKILIKGESGKGKTTLLHLLAGLFVPHQGKINIGTTDLTQLSDEERTIFRKDHMGIVFQKLNLIEYFTALENVELSGKTDALKVLSSLGLASKANERASVMSLGE